MPEYQDISISYEPNPYGPSDVFATSCVPFTAASLGKDGHARNMDRQAHFENQLLRMRNHLDTNRLPVFVNWEGQKRMDKGCIGHSVARGFILPLEDGPDGYVDSVWLREGT